MMYVLDPNVVSVLRKVGSGKADANHQAMGAEWVDAAALLCIGHHPELSGRTLPADTALAMRCARLHIPDRRGERDALISDAAIVHGMTVVTRKVAGFREKALVCPWEAA